ncbi:MAG: CpsD/CapB family tyrosine-protein kinase, partial [Gemmatimonadales bacterium]
HTIPEYATVLLRNLDTQIASSDSAITASKQELQQIPVRSTEEDRLRRDEDTEAKILDALTQRYTAARLIEASAIPDISIMDLAVAPLKATKNRRFVIVALGVVLGLGAGLGLVLLFDITDNRVRYADQITGGLGLTILGVIPEIKRAKGETPTPEEAAQVIEAFRTVRLNLSHTVGSDRVVLTIASPAPSDGKSLIASNLALSFAEAGYKTLLVDGDTRRGELHRTFGLERRPGLLDYLSDELPQASLIRMTSHPQLRLITAGSRKRNAPELLGSAKMRELVNRLRDQFEVIIIDSPPLGAGIDPFVLSTITGNMVLVVRAGATERDLAETKLQIVDQLPIRLVGAILNDVRATMHEYKYYSYSYGYGTVEEGEEPGKLPAVLDTK